MKTIGIIALMAVLMAVSVLADVTVHGEVKLADGITDAGEGIAVDVQCDDGEVTVAPTVYTDIQSEYVVSFTTEQCGNQSLVTASTAGDEVTHVVGSGPTDLLFPGDIQMPELWLLNLELSIPEFSAIAAGVAFAGAGLGYVFMRKRR